MSRHEHDTEIIYLPGPSYGPVMVGLGLLLIGVGIFSWIAYLLMGVVFALTGVIVWVRTARQELARMPREQQAFSTARHL
ncbi:MAG: hypothetical protein ACR2NA_13290 [Solirubrobacterales bacterium]